MSGLPLPETDWDLTRDFWQAARDGGLDERGLIGVLDRVSGPLGALGSLAVPFGCDVDPALQHDPIEAQHQLRHLVSARQIGGCRQIESGGCRRRE